AVRMVRRICETPLGMAGGLIVPFWVLVAIGAPLLAPHDPNKSFVGHYDDLPPSLQFLLGRDNQGRDILSRIIWGSRIVLTTAPLATSSAYLVGCTMGLLAGYYQGRVDAIIS